MLKEKGIRTGIATSNDRKLVEDKTLELILNAALIAHYGRAMLAFDRLEGRA